MTYVRTEAVPRLEERVCLWCGYRGPELRGPPIQIGYTCPSCDGDLYARPARSYAEMEGLDGSVGNRGARRGHGAVRGAGRRVSGWRERLVLVIRRGVSAWLRLRAPV